METNVRVQSLAVDEEECRAAPMYCCDNERQEAAGRIGPCAAIQRLTLLGRGGA
jgi:hypothetical protein